jgi:hypothetical protein
MNLRNFFAELKRRYVQKVAIRVRGDCVVAHADRDVYHSLKSPLCSCVSITLPASL